MDRPQHLDNGREQEQPREKTEKHEPGKRSCHSCRFENAIDSQFCEECGVSLVQSGNAPCERCGFANDVGARFCENCGKPACATLTGSHTSFDGPLDRTMVYQTPPVVADVKSTTDYDAVLAAISVFGSNSPEVAAPPPALLKEGQAERMKADHSARFPSRKDEVLAILQEFENRRLEVDRLGAGLTLSPKIELWRCRHEDGYHFAPHQCARPERGGQWEWLTLEEFKKLKWFRESA